MLRFICALFVIAPCLLVNSGNELRLVGALCLGIALAALYIRIDEIARWLRDRKN